MLLCTFAYSIQPLLYHVFVAREEEDRKSMQRYCQSLDNCSPYNNFITIIALKVFGWSYLKYFLFKIIVNILIPCVNIILNTLFAFSSYHLSLFLSSHIGDVQTSKHVKSVTILKLHTCSYFHTGGTCKGT